jgi:adenine-specific DNA-methyltransferase
MYPRLKLARNLLTDDGVIFISIDDNEVSNLRKICDEIFGEVNLITILSIKTGGPGGFKSKANKPVKVKESILIYAISPA